MAALLLGFVLAAAGLVLLFDVAGAGRALIRGVTSRSLGSLAPGYAASQAGFRVYAGLVLALGAALVGVGVVVWLPLPGASLIAIAAGGFLLLSVVAIRGEVKTYRALQRKG